MCEILLTHCGHERQNYVVEFYIPFFSERSLIKLLIMVTALTNVQVTCTKDKSLHF